MRKVVPAAFPDPTIRDAQAFGQAVRAARTVAGVSLEAAAEALGISKATLGDLEGGKGTVAIGTALRVARDLGVAVLAAPQALQFEAATLLQRLRREEPAPWGGLEPDAAAVKPTRPAK